MLVRVLGAAAGGGFPQWNCGCTGCSRARAGDPAARPRTQASIAVSADGAAWVLLNASPDLPAQIAAAPCLWPKPGQKRGTPVAAVVISGGDIDCIAGLLSLRESQALAIYADDFVRQILNDNQVFRVLNPDYVAFHPLEPEAESDLRDAAGAAFGLRVTAFAVPGKIPLYQEHSNDPAALASPDAVIGLCVADDAGHRMFYIPGCGHVTPALKARFGPRDVVFFDGTLWRDDEMIVAGLGVKTGRRMGHISVSGPDGSIAALADAAIGRRIFIHINNTNPILCDDSPEAAFVRAAGWEIAYDGMELSL